MLLAEVFMHRCFALLAAAMAILVTGAWPQASTGRVSGTVTDQTGAVMASFQGTAYRKNRDLPMNGK